MTSEALQNIRGFAHAGRVQFTRHAEQRMMRRGVTVEDARSALCKARECRAGKEDNWIVAGPDMGGDEFHLGVLIEDGVLVVTVFE